ncbi:SRPBCC family protein [Poritiphilus flavus]|uniref:Cell division protein n=1 Tax=Poritiphilus flavus TaxID=2697053 RepID=A0A6L9ECW1_9FLAO|nr:SRPBCC family protein [Poritiphilus flavus]NAS12229.1 cell division protein [Poritiphilus flavus]
MPRIELKTKIRAKKEIVFDLARSIDLHKISTEHTDEQAVDGKTSGLIGAGEWVTWRAKHLGVYQNLTSRITEFKRPDFFADEMVKGAFKHFRHEHHFAEVDGKTLMTDFFDYTSPFGLLGVLADRLFLKNYMKGLLVKRNDTIKEFAESERWKEVLSS